MLCDFFRVDGFMLRLDRHQFLMPFLKLGNQHFHLILFFSFDFERSFLLIGLDPFLKLFFFLPLDLFHL